MNFNENSNLGWKKNSGGRNREDALWGEEIHRFQLSTCVLIYKLVESTCFVWILSVSACFAMIIVQNWYQGLRHPIVFRGLTIVNSLHEKQKNKKFNNIMKGILLFTSKLKYGVFFSMKMLVYNRYTYVSLSFKVIISYISEILVHTSTYAMYLNIA